MAESVIENPITESPYPDYGYWFGKERWTIEEMAALAVGLNPNVVWMPEVRQRYIDDGYDDLSLELHLYTERFAYAGDWHQILDKSYN